MPHLHYVYGLPLEARPPRREGVELPPGMRHTLENSRFQTSVDADTATHTHTIRIVPHMKDGSLVPEQTITTSAPIGNLPEHTHTFEVEGHTVKTGKPKAPPQPDVIAHYTPPNPPPAEEPKKETNWMFWIGGILGAIGLVGLGVLIARKKTGNSNA